jgi:hypothetical protein
VQDQPVLFVKVSETRWETVDAAFDRREWPECEEGTATNSTVSTAIKASLDSGIDIGGAKQRPDGINLQEESEAEQESERS